MKIIFCAIPVLLAAVAITAPVSAPDNAGLADNAAALPQSADSATRAEPVPEPEPTIPLTEQPAPAPVPAPVPTPTLAAAPRREPILAEREQSAAEDGAWQVVRQRRPEAARDVRPLRTPRQATDPSALAAEHEAQRQELLEQQAREIEQVLERQRREYEELLERQEQASAIAGRERDSQPVEFQTEPHAADFSDFSDQGPRPDAAPGDAYREDVRPLERERRETIEIPLPGRRTLRFRLW